MASRIAAQFSAVLRTIRCETNGDSPAGSATETRNARKPASIVAFAFSLIPPSTRMNPADQHLGAFANGVSGPAFADASDPGVGFDGDDVEALVEHRAADRRFVKPYARDLHLRQRRSQGFEQR